MKSTGEGDDAPPAALEIPYRELSATALTGVIEAFVLREGTDYGEIHHSLADKVQQVLRQLERHDARIVFDPLTESVDIVVTVPLRRRPGGE
jgi:uncharacterized protein YheU (UPF0270 family)